MVGVSPRCVHSRRRAAPTFIRLLFLLLSLLALPVRAQEGEAPPPAAAPDAAAPPAEAAPSAEDLEKRKEEAKVRFQKGLELVQNESWDAALAEFLVSRELFPTKVALKNAAVCLRQLKRYVEALAMYNELIQRFESTIPPDERKTIDAAIVQLKGNVGEIQIDSDQAGSSVVIDGQQQQGVTPLPAIAVNAGTHSIRVSKEGFEAHEEQVLVAGGQRKTIRATLKALSAIGRLIVKESAGKTLDVVVDGVVAGKTPVFQGVVAVGPHTVLLRGEGQLGTAPAPVNVKENQSATLTLTAVELDAEIRVEPTPASATVFVDGVEIGSGVWEGRLPSGDHKVEIAADGFVAFRKDVRLIKGEREMVKVALERDLSNPMWQAGFVPHIYAELFGGIAMAPGGFGGGTAEACSNGDCSDESAPFGFVVGARAGYELIRGLGVELGFGYIRMSGTATRTITATADNNVPFTSDDYEDKTTASGLLLAASASYRLLDTTPLTFRISAGAARLTGKFTNGGTFTGDVPNPGDPNEIATVSQHVEIAEKDASIWAPFVAPEARFGYRFSKKLSIDLGVAFYVMLPPPSVRTAAPSGSGFSELNRAEGDRRLALDDVADAYQNPPGAARPGVLSLPKEDGFGTFFAIVPTIGGRFDF